MKILELKEHKSWLGFKIPAWVVNLLVIFCLVMAAMIAASTVANNPDAPIEYKTSHLSYDPSGVWGPSSSTKKIYWRVKQSEVPRWKRPTNRWNNLKHANAWIKWGDVTDAEMSDMYTLEEYQEIKKTCLTVGDIRKYEQDQKKRYKQYNRKEVEKARMKKAKDLWDEN